MKRTRLKCIRVTKLEKRQKNRAWRRIRTAFVCGSWFKSLQRHLSSVTYSDARSLTNKSTQLEACFIFSPSPYISHLVKLPVGGAVAVSSDIPVKNDIRHNRGWNFSSCPTQSMTRFGYGGTLVNAVYENNRSLLCITIMRDYKCCSGKCNC